jgi:Carboxypeptidase regulatory-like domain/TonB dependent receptor
MNHSLSVCQRLITLILLQTAIVAARSPLVELQGEVRDQRGDLIAGAHIRLSGSNGILRETVSDGRGQFRFSKLETGSYALIAEARGFASRKEAVILSETPGVQRVSITLFPSIEESIDVSDRPNEVALDPDRAAGAQTLNEEQLKILPDDPDQFLALLQSLATSSGGAAGQAAVTVDGFAHEGRLPPKSAIREVKVNSNIFSAEYDRPPYRGGRIDIYTKPGADSLHGSAFFNFNDAALNARDVFAPERAPVRTRRYGFQIGGPIAPKRAGFLLDCETRDIYETTTINAVILDRNLQPANFTASAPAPKLLTLGSARADWQPTPAHTFIVRYDINRDRSRSQGVGGFDLPSRATGSRAASHSLRFAEAAVIGGAIFNEARVGVTFNDTVRRAFSNEPAIIVLGAFNDGGAEAQSLINKEWRMEISDNLSIAAGRHSLKLGAQINGRSVRDERRENYNGQFIFGGVIAPQLDAVNNVVIGNGGQPAMINISGLEQYRRTLLDLPGGVPARFSINRGEPAIDGRQWTMAIFAQDEWRWRPDSLISLGLRYEAQTNPADRTSLAPRLGIGYSPDRQRRWVLRARAGLFYDRINLTLPLEALRFDGVRQQQVIIDAPSFSDPFKGGVAVDVIPAIRRANPELRPPVSFQIQTGFERQIARGWKLEVSHYWSRGWGLLRSRNINAPLVDDGIDPLSAPRPLGVKQNILQFEASGSLTGQVLFAGLNRSGGKHLNIFSGYLWFNFHTDADQPFLLPQSSYDLQREWARPSWQARHRVFFVGLIDLPWGVRASTELNLASGIPYNVTTGRDNNGDGNFNDRPGVAAAGLPNAIETSFGPLDPSAINGTLRRNAGTNPLSATVDLNVSRTFGLGGRRRGGDRRYQMAFNARANNLFNRANLGGIDGVLNSPFFGRAQIAAPARRVEIGVRFNF